MSQVATSKGKLIGKLIGFLAFLFLGYLGIRNYYQVTDQVKVNASIEEIFDFMYNTHRMYENKNNYKDLDYSLALSAGIIPEAMIKRGQKKGSEPLNSFGGGIDIFASPRSKSDKEADGAFEISFQGLSQRGCIALMRIHWNSDVEENLIAVAGYPHPAPANVLQDVSAVDDRKNADNVFWGKDAPYVNEDRLKLICACKEDTCSVVWKFF